LVDLWKLKAKIANTFEVEKKTRVRKGSAESTFPEEVPYLVVGVEAAGKFQEDIFVLEVSLL